MSYKFQALLLCAGEGTRLRPLTLSTPKCLVPILGRPLLDYWLELLDRGPRPERIWINTSYLASQVCSFLDASKVAYNNLKLTTSFEPKLLGTAGTLLEALPRLDSKQDLLLAHADNLTWFSLVDFLYAHQTRPIGTEMTMMTFKTDAPENCGIVELDRQNVVQGFYEKVSEPPSNLANGAVFLISPKGLEQIKGLGRVREFSTEVIPRLVGTIFAWENTVYHRDVGTPIAYRAAQTEFDLIAKNFGLKIL